MYKSESETESESDSNYYFYYYYFKYLSRFFRYYYLSIYFCDYFLLLLPRFETDISHFYSLLCQSRLITFFNLWG